MRGGVQKLYGQCPNAFYAIYNGASLTDTPYTVMRELRESLKPSATTDSEDYHICSMLEQGDMLHNPHPLSHKTTWLEQSVFCTHRASGPECPQASSCQMYVLSCHPPVGLFISTCHFTCQHHVCTLSRKHLYSVHNWGYTGLSAPRWDAMYDVLY